MKTLKLIAFIFLIALYACESKEQKIKSEWKFIEGFRFGDFLSFKHQNLRIENDTLYKDSKPFAVIVELKTDHRPGTENKLILRDIKTGEIGIYTDKGK